MVMKRVTKNVISWKYSNIVGIFHQHFDDFTTHMFILMGIDLDMLPLFTTNMVFFGDFTKNVGFSVVGKFLISGG